MAWYEALADREVVICTPCPVPVVRSSARWLGPAGSTLKGMAKVGSTVSAYT